MAVDCTPQSLITASTEFCCITGSTTQAVKLYLLRQIAGLEAMTPQELLAAATCFISCIPQGAFKAVEAYLLCQIANGGSGPPAVCSNLSGADSPVGFQTPDFIGQIYIQDSGVVWQATGPGNSDWTQLGTFGWSWGPSPQNLVGDTDWNGGGNILDTLNNSIFPAAALTAYTDLEFYWPETTGFGGGGGGINFSGQVNITSLGFIKLKTCGTVNQGGPFNMSVCTALVRLYAPSLEFTANAVSVGGCTALTSLEIPSLQQAESIDVTNCPILTAFSAPSLVSAFNGNVDGTGSGILTVSMPVVVTILGNVLLASNGTTTWNAPLWVPTNATTIDLSGNALDQTSVDQVLARCVANAGYVAGTVDLSGGTSATPSATGLADKATLIGRGVVVNTN